MKQNHLLATSAVLCVIHCASPAFLIRAADSSNQLAVVTAVQSTVSSKDSQQEAKEDLGYDFAEGKSNKIARVYSVTPLYVQVIYEGGLGGRKIPRQDLPPQLKTRYPYDAAKVAEYQKQQIETAARQAAAQNAAAREMIFRREQEITREIAVLREQDAAIVKEANILRKLPAGNGRKAKLSHLNAELQQIRERAVKLREQLEQIRAQRDSRP